MKFLCIFLCFFSVHLQASQEDFWAYNTLQNMTLDEKLGQLFMIAAYVNPDYAVAEIQNAKIMEDIEIYISQYYVGGLTFVGSSECLKQAVLTNHYQNLSKYPLLIAQDLEWGLSMRMKDGMNFPKNCSLGALEDNHLIYRMGREIARQAKLVGVHMNLSPVLDVNIEPENLSINVRSFGDKPEIVAAKGIAMLKGLQDGGVISSAKHFPGLGDIEVDPHLGLPYSAHNRDRLDNVELYPFKKAIEAGVLSIQSEHVVVPTLDDSNMPASLSQKMITGILKNELGFQGLIISGALRMKALTDHYTEEQIVLEAFKAGNDMLLMPKDLPKAFLTLKNAYFEGKISLSEIDERVFKILALKKCVGLDIQKTIPLPTLKDFYSTKALILRKTLYENIVKIQRNDQALIPLNSQFANAVYIQLGEHPDSFFCEELSKYLNLQIFQLGFLENNYDAEERLLEAVEKAPLVIIGVFPADPRRIAEIRLLNNEAQHEALKQFRVHGISESTQDWIERLKPYDSKTIVTYFGNPFGLHFFKDFSSLIMAFESDSISQEKVRKMLAE